MFDFETSHLKKKEFTSNKESVLVRIHKDQTSLEDKSVDLYRKFGWHAQKLINIKKHRNHYILESPDIEAMANMTVEEKK